ncbi:MAG: hypothetical protein ACRDJN_24490 [Chloroflexota bacterium]
MKPGDQPATNSCAFHAQDPAAVGLLSVIIQAFPGGDIASADFKTAVARYAEASGAQAEIPVEEVGEEATAVLGGTFDTLLIRVDSAVILVTVLHDNPQPPTREAVVATQTRIAQRVVARLPAEPDVPGMFDPRSVTA